MKIWYEHLFGKLDKQDIQVVKPAGKKETKKEDAPKKSDNQTKKVEQKKK